MKTPRIEYLTSRSNHLSSHDMQEIVDHMALADGVIESMAFVIEDEHGRSRVPEEVYEYLTNLIESWRVANAYKRYDTCRHCNKQIGWGGSNWKHSETRSIECNPSTIAEPQATIVAATDDHWTAP